MAHPSPSPSGSSSRRLSEVLSEQQEPFSLDIYLLEKGCSPAFLDSASCRGGACSTCWPGTGSTGRTLRRPARRKKGSRGSGVLRLLLSKILSGVSVTKAPPAAAKKRQQPVKAIDWRRIDENQRTPAEQYFKQHAFPSPRHAVDSQRMDDDGDGREHGEEEEEDEASKKQLSPVSVLEQRLFEHSPPPPHAQEALAIFSELLEAAYTPSSLLDLLAHGRDYRSISSTKSKAGGTSPTTQRAMRRKKKKKKDHDHHAHAHAHREVEEDDMAALLEKDLGTVSALVASELGSARVAGAAELWASREDVGAAVAAAVLEALTEETAAELIVVTMGVDHACAVDTARC